MADDRRESTADDGPEPNDELQRPSAATNREPLVSDDPLGLGGTAEPDAPSRSSNPGLLSLIGEFVRMSRTTAILLGVFLVVGTVYLMVREEPVVDFRSPPPAPVTATEDRESSEPSESEVTETGETSTEESAAPTSPTGSTPTDVPTAPGDDDEVSGPAGRNPTSANPSATVPDTGDAGGASPTGAPAQGDQQGGGTAGPGTTPTE